MDKQLYRLQNADESRRYGYGRMICTVCGRSISAGGRGLRSHADAHARKGEAVVVPEQYLVAESDPRAEDPFNTAAEDAANAELKAR